ncbi:hypothetical protein P691DRAFT_26290 [Macrolepiota fuliginosa MF-IS2]|uniref:Uncharacterized protein n=1 Tax=Macrolepiota fuliginosa MF-IS2 TaxID=1400762 RepID=A0A9P5XCD1_9AGAR|nr:hypothetical protein P691DRAFT_26290 [Macrolepiota fuliginosa MF-IS2]
MVSAIYAFMLKESRSPNHAWTFGILSQYTLSFLQTLRIREPRMGPMSRSQIHMSMGYLVLVSVPLSVLSWLHKLLRAVVASSCSGIAAVITKL